VNHPTSAPAYGVLEQEGSGDTLAAHAECVRLAGHTVVPGGFTAEQLADLRARLDAVLARQAEEFGGTARLAAIGDALTARCPLAYDEAFLRLAAHDTVLALCRRLLGDYIVLLQQNGVVNPSGETHTQTSYHRDLPYQHFVSSRPLAISALFCLDPFRVDTGATLVLPGSHRVESFPSAAVMRQLEVPVAAPAGSFIVFDAMLFHRAGHNVSGAPRRAVNHVYGVPVLAQQVAIAPLVPEACAADPALARLLGQDVSPAASVAAWRERRLQRAARPSGRE
jgi:ectoine hydroxylase-related dioxygenase (phytanoyl-CoA dioxygenase family)